LGLTFDNLMAICTEVLHLCETEMLVQWLLWKICW
jgi:hypothetical protein